ncbi:hypothetical protein Ocin01_02967 [Orchesella cincta]|uniref:Uncharacterized protein n=1 Tax=Orchesella cincta TaxID=48709 RepID=A0A1D2NEU2_ORCCI|nr:hypothetical protein Ocin01_02967 [Orchesella cincta]
MKRSYSNLTETRNSTLKYYELLPLSSYALSALGAIVEDIKVGIVAMGSEVTQDGVLHGVEDGVVADGVSTDEQFILIKVTKIGSQQIHIPNIQYNKAYKFEQYLHKTRLILGISALDEYAKIMLYLLSREELISDFRSVQEGVAIPQYGYGGYGGGWGEAVGVEEVAGP